MTETLANLEVKLNQLLTSNEYKTLSMSRNTNTQKQRWLLLNDNKKALEKSISDVRDKGLKGGNMMMLIPGSAPPTENALAPITQNRGIEHNLSIKPTLVHSTGHPLTRENSQRSTPQLVGTTRVKPLPNAPASSSVQPTPVFNPQPVMPLKPSLVAATPSAPTEPTATIVVSSSQEKSKQDNIPEEVEDEQVDDEEEVEDEQFSIDNLDSLEELDDETIHE